jgi:hypothetical protein
MPKKIKYSELPKQNSDVVLRAGLRAAKNLLAIFGGAVNDGSIRLTDIAITNTDESGEDVEIIFTPQEYVTLAQSTVGGLLSVSEQAGGPCNS